MWSCICIYICLVFVCVLILSACHWYIFYILLHIAKCQQMGVPVGMPHVVLQTASGPPQVYRIVLEPSVSTSTPQSGTSLQAPAPILAQELSGEHVTHLTPASTQHHLEPHASHTHHTHTEAQVRQVWWVGPRDVYECLQCFVCVCVCVCMCMNFAVCVYV